MKIQSHCFMILLLLLSFGGWHTNVSAFDLRSASENAPEIYYQSGPEAVERSANVDFYAFSKEEAVSYQWWCDNQPLVDTDNIKGSATNHLSISSVVCADSGKVFQCVLSNAYGTAKSETFTLTVKHVYDQREQNETTLIQKETCYREGKYYYTCLCGAIGDIFTVDLLPHSGGTATCKEQAICSMCNQPYGEISGEHHFGGWQADETSHWHQCSVCNIKQDTTTHQCGAAATETTPQRCTVCGYVITPALGHQHKTTYIPEVASTCMAQGSSAYYYCDCGKYFADEDAEQEITDHSSLVLPLRAHSGGDATCQSPAICDFCKQEYGALANHIFDTMDYDDTGHWLKCSVCGLAQGAYPHQFETSDTGENLRVCIVCHYEEPILHRHYLTKISEKAATCTEEGHFAYYSCVCGRYFYDDMGSREISDLSEIAIPILSHHGGQATCKELAKCSECGQSYGEYGNHSNGALFQDAFHHWYQCEVCGEITGKSEHYGGNATCEHKGKCDVCGREYGSLLAHDATGLKYDADFHYSVCKNCGVSQGQSAHSWKLSSDSTLYKNIYRCDCGAEKINYSHPFKDVHASDWFYDDVIFTYHNGLLRGIKEDTFGIDTETSRAMIVTILYRLEGEPSFSYAPFKDVSLSQWFGSAVAWAAKNNIVEGYGNGFFGPDDPVTREQIASILYRYAVYKGYHISFETSLTSFPDASAVSNWAKDTLSWAVSQGLIRGMEENGVSYLRPQYNAMRTQIAAILHRFCTQYSN